MFWAGSGLTRELARVELGWRPGSGRSGLARGSGGRKVRDGFRANPRVGTPGLGKVVGGRKLWVGRKVQGPEVPGKAGSSGGRESAKNRDFEIADLGGKTWGKTRIRGEKEEIRREGGQGS